MVHELLEVSHSEEQSRVESAKERTGVAEKIMTVEFQWQTGKIAAAVKQSWSYCE